GDICPRPGNPGDICQTGEESEAITGFTDGLLSKFYPGWGGSSDYTNRIGVDGQGNVYASSGFVEIDFGVITGPGDARVVKFDPSGNYISMVHEKPSGNGAVIGRSAAIAIDEAGDLYIDNTFLGQAISKFTPADFTPTGMTTGANTTFPYTGE